MSSPWPNLQERCTAKREEADITIRLFLDDSDQSRSRLSTAVLWYEKLPMTSLKPLEIFRSINYP
jgi:hypothetical protein